MSVWKNFPKEKIGYADTFIPRKFENQDHRQNGSDACLRYIEISGIMVPIPIGKGKKKPLPMAFNNK